MTGPSGTAGPSGIAGPSGTARRTGPRELGRLLGQWTTPSQPAYVALATRVRLLVLDGRLPVGVRLPPERELASALGISRTTVSAAFDALRRSGHATSRQGSGTWTALPASGEDVPAWAPEPAPEGVLDLAHAAPSAPPQLHAAYAAALDELPRHLPGTGYDYRGLPGLRARVAERFTARGLPTAPSQVLITNGGLQGVRLALTLLVVAGDRVLVEQPSYPNVLDVVRDLGARLVPVPVHDGWDLDGVRAALRQTRPRAAYLVPDFQNPTGSLMTDDVRAATARLLGRSGTVAVVDETLVELGLDVDGDSPAPFAAHAGGTQVITAGSASKVFWGGLRVGWLRADAATVARLAALRSRQDLAGPVLEQLACAHLLDRLDEVRTHHLTALRAQRAVLARLLHHHLPSWRCSKPAGGQVLWCELPRPAAHALAAAAAERGVRVTPGPRFGADGTLESWLRLPFTRPVDELERAVPLLADAWGALDDQSPTRLGPIGAAPSAEEQYVV